jgi:hypothetical protein
LKEPDPIWQAVSQWDKTGERSQVPERAKLNGSNFTSWIWKRSMASRRQPGAEMINEVLNF